MKKHLMILALALSLAIPGIAFASEQPEGLDIEVIDSATGKPVLLVPKDETPNGINPLNNDSDIVYYSIDELSITDDGENGVSTLDIDLSFPVQQTENTIAPLYSNSNTINRYDCKAVVTAHFKVKNLSGGERQTCITKVSGSWTPKVSSIKVKNREVHAHQGWAIGGQNKTWNPTTNSYSRTTGWSKYWDAISTTSYYSQATSYCKVFVDGMGSGYEVNARVNVL